MDALIPRHLDAAEEANETDQTARRTGQHKKLFRSDPEATMATSSKAPLRPSYKQHTAVDDHAGIVVDVDIVTDEEHDAGRFAERLEANEATLGRASGHVTADAAHGVGRVFADLEARKIEAIIPARIVTRQKGAKGFPTERFKYDPHHDVVRCPAQKRLSPRNATKTVRW